MCAAKLDDADREAAAAEVKEWQAIAPTLKNLGLVEGGLSFVTTKAFNELRAVVFDNGASPVTVRAAYPTQLCARLQTKRQTLLCVSQGVATCLWSVAVTVCSCVVLCVCCLVQTGLLRVRADSADVPGRVSESQGVHEWSAAHVPRSQDDG